MAIEKIWSDSKDDEEKGVFYLTWTFKGKDEASVHAQNKHDLVDFTPDQFTEVCQEWLVRQGYECVPPGWEVQIETKKGEVFTGRICK